MQELQAASNLKQQNPAIKSKGFEFVNTLSPRIKFISKQ